MIENSKWNVVSLQQVRDQKKSQELDKITWQVLDQMYYPTSQVQKAIDGIFNLDFLENMWTSKEFIEEGRKRTQDLYDKMTQK